MYVKIFTVLFVTVLTCVEVDSSFWNQMTAYNCDNVTMVSRKEWGARPPKRVVHMNTPVTVLFIHHTDMQSCHSLDQCIKDMRIIQNFHMDDRGWNDIAYNYLIGEDGRVYEGRGWNSVGSHTLGWNDVSIAFSVMGNYTDHVPNDAAIAQIFGLMDCATSLKKLTPDFKMYGHRDVRPTSCPGEAFYKLIRTWKHYDHGKPVKPTPTPPRAETYEIFKLQISEQFENGEITITEDFEAKKDLN